LNEASLQPATYPASLRSRDRLFEGPKRYLFKSFLLDQKGPKNQGFRPWRPIPPHFVRGTGFLKDQKVDSFLFASGGLLFS
jgi:hypothetical protein